MKLLLTILLTFIVLSGNCQDKWIATDKALHFSYSAALTMLGTETAKDWKCKNQEVVGIMNKT